MLELQLSNGPHQPASHLLALPLHSLGELQACVSKLISYSFHWQFSHTLHILPPNAQQLFLPVFTPPCRPNPRAFGPNLNAPSIAQCLLVLSLFSSFFFSPSSIDQHYICKIVLHVKQNYDETSTKTRLKIGPPLT